MSESPAARPLGFWSCWALVVGTMIGSGVFLLPATLAPYGLLGFGGWIMSGAGTIALGLVFGGEAAAMMASGQRVLPARLIAAGYHFRFGEVEPPFVEGTPDDRPRATEGARGAQVVDRADAARGDHPAATKRDEGRQEDEVRTLEQPVAVDG